MSNFCKINNHTNCPCSDSKVLQFCSLRMFDEVICTKYTGKQMIFKEGTFFSGLYIIANGKVKIVCDEYNDQRYILSLSKTGDLISHWGFGGEWIYPVSAYTLEDTTICFIPKKSFIKLLKENSEFANEFMLLCAEELRQVTYELRTSMSLNSTGKLANALLKIGDKFGIDKKTGEINVNLSRKEIGEISGLSKGHLSRQLSTLIKEGIINKLGKGRILIKNYEKLRELIIDSPQTYVAA